MNQFQKTQNFLKIVRKIFFLKNSTKSSRTAAIKTHRTGMFIVKNLFIFNLKDN